MCLAGKNYEDGCSTVHTSVFLSAERSRQIFNFFLILEMFFKRRENRATKLPAFLIIWNKKVHCVVNASPKLLTLLSIKKYAFVREGKEREPRNSKHLL